MSLNGLEVLHLLVNRMGESFRPFVPNGKNPMWLPNYFIVVATIGEESVAYLMIQCNGLGMDWYASSISRDMNVLCVSVS